jgi:hypothetical protein
MTTHRFLFEHRNENAGGQMDPVGPLDGWRGERVIAWNFGEGPAAVDLTEEHCVCLSHDDNRLVTVPRWGIGDVTIPDWLAPRQWLRGRSHWRWFWGLGGQADWPEAWQRGLLEFGSCAQRLGCIRLLGADPKRQRSILRISLRQQLIHWLETPPELRHFTQPFSYKQWDYVANGYIMVEARRLDAKLYGDRTDPAVRMIHPWVGAEDGGRKTEARPGSAGVSPAITPHKQPFASCEACREP